jgi:hypothetical protein
MERILTEDIFTHSGRKELRDVFFALMRGVDRGDALDRVIALFGDLKVYESSGERQSCYLPVTKVIKTISLSTIGLSISLNADSFHLLMFQWVDGKCRAHIITSGGVDSFPKSETASSYQGKVVRTALLEAWLEAVSDRGWRSIKHDDNTMDFHCAAMCLNMMDLTKLALQWELVDDTFTLLPDITGDAQ